ncbi:MAG: hypothetical protein A3D44_01145 [Candidatus Staskawiczbacteria bacterium RIFCSPHIGHO2_02_FULL_42_22]|uniref:Uncharacterized protein n=1 Tax=Candidatus Staskawiczbacteria bacterium RIFCSPHIGHO2_02_FULL_42_22 TaxID=1802207 RepID=A0A1G2I3N9_9BACT|nr:MAG: hypothetical protein A3D44_01145 [Candidatus Staskawiczbacteria bacterium RIFCSPHIGHO2_02_FULL_42_22]
MFIRFKLKELQAKYTAVYTGLGGPEEFPAPARLVFRVVKLLAEYGHEARACDVVTNGLPWRVSCKTVSGEATLCIYVRDIVAPCDLAEYQGNEDVEVSQLPLPADFLYSPFKVAE